MSSLGSIISVVSLVWFFLSYFRAQNWLYNHDFLEIVEDLYKKIGQNHNSNDDEYFEHLWDYGLATRHNFFRLTRHYKQSAGAFKSSVYFTKSDLANYVAPYRDQDDEELLNDDNMWDHALKNDVHLWDYV